METLEFIIYPDGRVEERVTGIVGSSCADVTAAIEALDEAEWMGRSLKVNKAKPRESSDSFGGGRGGFKGGGGRPSGGGRNRY